MKILKTKKHRKILLFALAATTIFLAVFEIDFKEKSNAGQKAEIAFLDVGQGDAILIQEGRKQILIDGGDGEDILNRLGEEMPWGDREVEMVVDTHTDADHLGGLVKVLENYKVDQILQSGAACNKDLCQQWQEIIDEKNIPILDAKTGQEIKLGKDIDLRVFYPFTDLGGQEFDEANDTSVVIKAQIENTSYLLTGDISSKVEEKLISNNLDIGSDVLKVAHHGSKSSTSIDFLCAVTPEKAVISVGENSYGHPTEEVLNRLANMNIEIFRTDQDGTVKFFESGT